MSIAARANTLEGHNRTVIVIGGGASGIVAAICAKRNGANVVICERMAALGKKILASGNGRCNLSNDNLDISYYNHTAGRLAHSVFSRCGNPKILNFFKGLGLNVYSESGRIFPVTNQSATVLKSLEMELRRLSIPIEFGFKVSHITQAGHGFTISSATGRKISADAIIISCGGNSYPAFGSDGSAYVLAKDLGHAIIEPVPSAVPLVVKDELCHSLQGQRIFAHAKSFIDGKFISESSGDLLFAKYGLSGTAVIDLSRGLSIAINRNISKDTEIIVDMIPFMDEKGLAKNIADRIDRNDSLSDLVVGILPNKFGHAMKTLLAVKNPQTIARALKSWRFKVLGTRGWNEADFTAGGVDLNGIKEGSLESVRRNGLYFSGEILDVDGKRGGYNLAWAWASGCVAGEEAARCVS